MKKSDKARLENQHRVTAIAVRDALMTGHFARGVCDAASAAENFLAARQPEAARAILVALRTAHIEYMRSIVAREPGGVLNEANPPTEHEPK